MSIEPDTISLFWNGRRSLNTLSLCNLNVTDNNDTVNECAWDWNMHIKFRPEIKSTLTYITKISKAIYITTAETTFDLLPFSHETFFFFPLLVSSAHHELLLLLENVRYKANAWWGCLIVARKHVLLLNCAIDAHKSLLSWRLTVYIQYIVCLLHCMHFV